MSWFLSICFVILIVCVILQTIMMYKDSKQFENNSENINYNTKLTRIHNNDKEIFVCVDTITGIAITKLSENRYNIIIDCIDDRAYIEEYSSYDEAWERMEELSNIIENE